MHSVQLRRVPLELRTCRKLAKERQGKALCKSKLACRHKYLCCDLGWMFKSSFENKRKKITTQEDTSSVHFTIGERKKNCQDWMASPIVFTLHIQKQQPTFHSMQAEHYQSDLRLSRKRMKSYTNPKKFWNKSQLPHTSKHAEQHSCTHL